MENTTRDLQETTFENARTGLAYMTTRGFKVTVDRFEGDHVIVITSRRKEMRFPVTATCFGPVVEDAESAKVAVSENDADTSAENETPVDSDQTRETSSEVVEATEVATERPIRRDPRLPEIGTPIIRKWRGHVVVVKETTDGVFKVKVDRDYIGEARSLTKAAEMALATEGITSGVNGFAWFHVGEEAKSKNAATDRRLAALTGMLSRLEERIEVSENRVRRLMLERNDALRQIDKVRASMEAEAAAETTATED